MALRQHNASDSRSGAVQRSVTKHLQLKVVQVLGSSEQEGGKGERMVL